MTPLDKAAKPIQAEGLTKRYGETLALDGLDLSIEPGEVYGYLGPNGAGKTTTIRLLLGIHRPTRGPRPFGEFRAEQRLGEKVDQCLGEPQMPRRGEDVSAEPAGELAVHHEHARLHRDQDRRVAARVGHLARVVRGEPCLAQFHHLVEHCRGGRRAIHE